MPKARTRAEEALAKWQRAWLTHCDVMPSSLADAAIGIKNALEALLAEPARAPLAPAPAPEAHGCPVEGEPGHESCVGCGRPVRAEATETAPAPSEAVREDIPPDVPPATTEAEALIRLAYDARFGGHDWQRRASSYLWRDRAPAPSEAVREDVTVPPYPWTWERVARRVGEEFARTGPEGYYSFGPAEWQDWMLGRIYAQRWPLAGDAVREAAEATERALGAWIGVHSAQHAGGLVSAVRHLLCVLAARGGE